MPSITFKAKVEPVYNADDTLAYRRVKVPAIERRHCDMASFRSHPTFGPYANSDLFKGLLKRELHKMAVGDHIRLDRVPAFVEIDTTGFLAEVRIDLP